MQMIHILCHSPERLPVRNDLGQQFISPGSAESLLGGRVAVSSMRCAKIEDQGPESGTPSQGQGEGWNLQA